MRKIAVLAAATAIGMAVAWIAGAHVLSGTAFDSQWASDDFARGLPHVGENESATRILATAERIGDIRPIRTALRDVLRRKAPTPAVDQFLDKQGNTIRTLRAEIISNPPPVWASDPDEILDPVEPPLMLHFQLSTILGADALVQHGRGDDRAAWSDLRAASILADSLSERPEIASLMVAMSGRRIVADVSAKIDPAKQSPSFDVRPALLRAIEYEAWIIRTYADRYPAGEPDGSRLDDAVRRIAAPVVRPIRLTQAELQVGRMRAVAAAILRIPPCTPFPTTDMGEWAPLLQRINRLQPACDRRTSR